MATDIVDLAGKVVLVTGAGQGVGREIALRVAEHGAAGVVVNDFFEDRAKEVANEIAVTGVDALAVTADVGDFDSVQAMYTAVTERFGGLDILVNNAGNMGPAGIVIGPAFWEQDPAEWEQTIRVNFLGVLHNVRAALPSIIQRGGGSIVTIISDAGRVGEPHLETYSGAKAGAAGFMRAIAKSSARFGVRANCVALAATQTPSSLIQDGTPEEFVNKALRPYLIRRFGQPEDAANMVLFLVSNASSWVTGQTFVVNGGYSTSA